MDTGLERTHARLDGLISELSLLSQRVARIEVQESRVAENSQDINRLEDRLALMEGKISRSDGRNSIPPKSKTADYAEKGGLVLSGGVVVEVIRWILQLLQR